MDSLGLHIQNLSFHISQAWIIFIFQLLEQSAINISVSLFLSPFTVCALKRHVHAHNVKQGVRQHFVEQQDYSPSPSSSTFSFSMAQIKANSLDSTEKNQKKNLRTSGGFQPQESKSKTTEELQLIFIQSSLPGKFQLFFQLIQGS